MINRKVKSKTKNNEDYYSGVTESEKIMIEIKKKSHQT